MKKKNNNKVLALAVLLVVLMVIIAVGVSALLEKETIKYYKSGESAIIEYQDGNPLPNIFFKYTAYKGWLWSHDKKNWQGTSNTKPWAYMEGQASSKQSASNTIYDIQKLNYDEGQKFLIARAKANADSVF